MVLIKLLKALNTVVYVVITGVVSSIIGLGVANIPKPRFEYSIVSANRLIEDSLSMPCVKVLIEDSIDVQKSHFNITTYIIEVKNKGSKGIGNKDYDEDVFFGLKIKHGTLFEVPQFLSASNRHIIDKFSADVGLNGDKGGSKIVIPSITLNKGDSYLIKAVILHDFDTLPELTSQGTIKGQKKDILINGVQRSLWSLAFGGGWQVQLIRFLPYSFFVILLLLLILLADTKLSNPQKEEQSPYKAGNDRIVFDRKENDWE